MGELEEALAQTEHDASDAVEAATKLLRQLKSAHGATLTGDLKALEKAFKDAGRALQTAEEKLQALVDGWQFEFSSYGRDGFVQELLTMAHQSGLNANEQDGVIFAFPVLVTVLADDKSVRIDKAKVRKLRPSALTREIERYQRRPRRMDVGKFLTTLLRAYEVETKGAFGNQVRLNRIYELLTLLPRRGEEQYTRQEFARDLYDLDQSNALTTGDGRYRFFLSASTGTRQNPISVVGQDGRQRDYFAIAFEEAG